MSTYVCSLLKSFFSAIERRRSNLLLWQVFWKWHYLERKRVPTESTLPFHRGTHIYRHLVVIEFAQLYFSWNFELLIEESDHWAKYVNITLQWIRNFHIFICNADKIFLRAMILQVSNNQNLKCILLFRRKSNPSSKKRFAALLLKGILLSKPKKFLISLLTNPWSAPPLPLSPLGHGQVRQ